MKNIKNKFIAIVLAVIILFYMSNPIFAVVMTDDELDNAIETFKNNLVKEATELDASNTNLEINIKRENDKIIIESEGEKTEFNYDFSNEFKFYIDMEFTKNMTLEEAKSKADDSGVPINGVMIITSSKGCKAIDSLAYIMLESFKELGKDIILEDKSTNGLEYAKKLYQDTKPMETELFNASMEKISETDEKIILRSVYVVKENGDFTKVKGAFEQLTGQFDDENGIINNADKNESNNSNNANTNDNNNNNNVNTNTSQINKDKNEKEWPKAGIDTKQIEILEIIAYVLIAAIILVGGSLFAKKSK